MASNSPFPLAPGKEVPHDAWHPVGAPPRPKRDRVACIVLLAIGGFLFSALLVAIVLRLFVVRSNYIPGAAMEPGIAKGSVVLVSLVAYRSPDRSPQRYDVAVFRPPGMPGVEYIKRVIALPGETVEVKDGAVLVNGKPVEAGYFREPAKEDFALATVPSECYFVLGDNLNHSDDSRSWGFVPRRDFTGKMIGIIYMPKK